MAEFVTTTPSGIEIVFEDGLPDEDGKRKRRSYTVDGDKLTSVTTVLGVIAKDGLQWAAEKVTAESIVELAEHGLPIDRLTPEQVLAAMEAENLRFRQVWNDAADLGTAMHELPLETWLPEAEVLQNEVMVASKHHGFAGRFDYLVRYHGVVVRLDLKTTKEIERYKKDGPHYKKGDAKPPYKEHVAQLGGYEIAAAECGYPTADLSGVLRVTHDGDVDLFLTRPRERLFIAALELYKATREPIPSVTLASA